MMRPHMQRHCSGIVLTQCTYGRTYGLTENASHSQGKFFRYVTRARMYGDLVDFLGASRLETTPRRAA